MQSLRVLSDNDILINPLDNGLVAKKVLYNLTKEYLEMRELAYLNTLTEQEKQKYIHSQMKKFISKYYSSLNRRFDNYNKDILELLSKPKRKGDAKSYITFKSYLSTLNNHLINGTKLDTEWISATISLKSLKKYYDTQPIHRVALIDVKQEEINRKILMLNLSSKEDIARINHILCRKIDPEDVKLYQGLSEYIPSIGNVFISDILNPTDIRFMGYNYSASDREICFFRRIPNSNVRLILGALETDMALYGILDIDAYFKETLAGQRKWLKMTKSLLLEMVKLYNDSTLLRIYDELYLQDKNESKTSMTLLNPEYIHSSRLKILKLARKVPNSYIKFR